MANPNSNPAINAAVQQIISAATNPIKQARTTYDAQSGAQQEHVKGLTQALASILQGIGPGVEQTYADASKRQASFAQGFTQELQQRLGQNADNTSSFLQNVVGAPQSQIDQAAGQANPAGAGNALYAIRGYIPASTLNEEGAAYTANARQLPGVAASQGLQQIGRIQQAQQAQDAKFAQDIAGEAGKAPQYRQQLATDLFDQQYKTKAQKIEIQKLIDSEANTKFDQTFKVDQAKATQAWRQTQADFKSAGLKLQSEKYNLDVQKLIAAGAKPNAPLSKLYGHIVDSNGNAISGADGKPIVVKATNGAKPLSPTKINQLQGDAAAIASDTFNGFTDGKTGKKFPPLNFGQALAEMRKGAGNGQIPLPLALHALKQAGYTIPRKYNKIIGGAPGQGDPFAGSAPSADWRIATGPEGAGGVWAPSWNQKLSASQRTAVAKAALAAVDPSLASAANINALVGRINQESGGQTAIVNKWDSNWKNGIPSIGLLQTIGPTFDHYKAPSHGNIWDPLDNAIAAVRYMLATYGRIVGPSGTGY